MGKKDLIQRIVEYVMEDEWLVTNGLGGYASSTASWSNTSKYHGLLIAAFSSEDRRVFVSGIRESFPKSIKVEKSIFMPHGLNTSVVSYKICDCPKGAKISGDILVTSRDHHWILQNPQWDFTFTECKDVLCLTPTHEMPPTIGIGSDGSLKPAHEKVDLYYKKDESLGYPSHEKVFVGAKFEIPVEKGKEYFLVFSADMSYKKAKDVCQKVLKTVKGLRNVNRLQKDRLVKGMKGYESLACASSDFIIDKGKDKAIIAGYPWFGEWGRDTLISLPGLCLTTGRKEDAQRILLNLGKQSEGGLIPNNFQGGKSMNSLDASLWYFWTVWKYVEYTKDYVFVKKLWPGMKKIIKRYESFLDSDGLVKIESGIPMTWMDARVEGKAVTLREGKPVEIQALWYNALEVCTRLAKRFKEKDNYSENAIKCRNSFQRFWNAETKYLYDVMDPYDASIRPNALIAISLPFPVLDRKRWKAVVDKARIELVTPYGLRTLSPDDSAYRGSSQGNQKERDLSYHQGDAWPWLLGPFIEAYKKTYPMRPIAKFIGPLLAWVHRTKTVPELFDGDKPHMLGGCINQAWSAAELMRIIYEYS